MSFAAASQAMASSATPREISPAYKDVDGSSSRRWPRAGNLVPLGCVKGMNQRQAIQKSTVRDRLLLIKLQAVTVMGTGFVSDGVSE